MFFKNFSSNCTSYKESTLFPVLTAEKLLSGPDQKRIVKKIRGLLPISEQYYQSFYGKLIDRFAEFVQVLPKRQGLPLMFLLNEGLERALVALEVMTEHKLSKPDDPIMFAVFSASLLSEVARVHLKQRIVISARDGSFLKEWHPHHGSLVGQGSYFKFRPVYDEPNPSFFSALNVMYAQHIMPSNALDWLSSHRSLLVMWLSYLEGDEEGSGKLRLSLNLIQQRLKALRDQRLNTLPFNLEFYEPKETALGEAFWKWLKEGLRSGTIPINQPDGPVFLVREGILLVGTKIFKDFIRSRFKQSQSKRPNWARIREQLGTLGLLAYSGEDMAFQQNLARHPHSVGRELQKRTDSVVPSLFLSNLKKPFKPSAPFSQPYNQPVFPHQEYVVYGCVIPRAEWVFGQGQAQYRLDLVPKSLPSSMAAFLSKQAPSVQKSNFSPKPTFFKVLSGQDD